MVSQPMDLFVNVDHLMNMTLEKIHTQYMRILKG